MKQGPPERPVVSVVMSVYNGEAELEASLDSVLSQEGPALELIVVDDGSTDGSSPLLEERASRDPRLRVIRQENAGLTRALIRGCSLARGVYIARQDADDLSLPGRFAAQVAYLEEHPDVSFVSCWSEIVSPEGHVILTHTRPADPEEATRMFVQREAGPPGHGSVMMRRSLYERVGGYRSAFYYAQDQDLWFRLIDSGRLGYVPKVLYRYRVSPNSISGGHRSLKAPFAHIASRAWEARKAGQEDAEIVREAELLPVNGSAPDNRADTLYFIGRCLQRSGRPEARRYLWRAALQRPTRLKAWVMLLMDLVGLGR